MLKQTEKLARRDDFAVLTVSLDRPDTISGCRKLIRKYGIQHPVLWFGPEESSWGTLDWEIRDVPSAYLIDPQGNILLDLWVDENFATTAKFIMAHPALFSPYGMEWSRSTLSDGSYKLDLHVTNPWHQPMDIKLTAYRYMKEYRIERDGESIVVDPIPEGKEWNSTCRYPLDGFNGIVKQAAFRDFGETSLSLTLPHPKKAFLLQYLAEFTLPGTEQLNNGAGISLMASGDFDIEEPQQPEVR